ncbi:MAG TPA: GAF domain-containing protein [Thermoanaerobaculia bacterium]|nr:GAF domain-containing protein [Thermoanaerobaculia bacterium]
MADLGTTPLQEQLDRIAKAAQETLEAEACGVFLVADKKGERGTKELILEASVGHREKGAELGKRLPIKSCERCGLTSHIAYQGELFHAYGRDLRDHFAVTNPAHELRHTEGPCVSLLAMPLHKKAGEKKELVGLLRIDNKRRPDGQLVTESGFDEDDKWLIQLFAGIAVVAIENAELMHYKSSLISSCPSGIIAVNRQGIVTEYNDKAAKILGKPREEAMNRPVHDLYMDPNEPHNIGDMLREKGGRIEDYKTLVRGPNGEPIPILHAATWLIAGGSSGQRLGSVGYFQDVSELRKLERRDTLLKTIDLVAKTSDMETGLQRFTEEMVQLLGRSYCAVRLLENEERPVLTLRAASRIDDSSWRPPIHARMTIDECPGLLDLLAGGVPKIRQSEDERFRFTLQRLTKSMGFDRHLQSVLIGPLNVGGRIVGLIELGDRRSITRETFAPDEEIELVGVVAAQMGVLMDRLHLIEQTTLRERRLAKLARSAAALRPEADLATLLRHVVRLAPELIDYGVAGIYLWHPPTKKFVLREGEGLPRGLIEQEPEAVSVIATAGRDRETQYARTLTLSASGVTIELGETLAVPLRVQSGLAEGVLFVANPTQQLRIDGVDQDVLERFAFHVATAVQTARLLSHADRTGGRAEVLDHVTDYILKCTDEEKLHHAFLTGITASYGLRFNRAFLFGIDDSENYLVGKYGIGELDQKDADASWNIDEESGLVDFGRYVQRSEAGEIGASTIGQLIRSVQFQIGVGDHFSEVIRGHDEYRIVDPSDFGRLPEFFFNQFRVTSHVVIVPLGTSGKRLGLLVADNKFTRAPVDTNVNALTAFARTVTVALENRALLKELDDHQRQLEAFYAMSSDLAAVTDPDLILGMLADRAIRTMNAYGATLLLFDSTRTIVKRIPLGRDREVDPKTGVRDNGITMEVLRTGKARKIEDVGRGTDLNPLLMFRGIKAALCAPLSLPDKQLGVIWFHYDRPRRFSMSLVGALQLVLNQATVAYEQARRIKALEGIREAAESLAATEDLGGVLNRIVDSARRLFHASSSILWLSDGERFLAERSVSSGLDAQIWEARQAQGPAAMGIMIEHLRGGWIGISDYKTASDSTVPQEMLDFLEEVDARGYQLVPLSVGEEKLGVLCTVHKSPVPPGEDQQFIAEEFATHSAWSLKKARLLETVMKAKAAAKVVAEVVASGTQRTVREKLDRIAQLSLDALGCGAVVLFASNDGDLSHPAATAGVNFPEAMENDAEKQDYDLVRRLLKAPRPEIVPNVREHPDFMQRRFVLDEEIRSCAAFPLRAGDTSVGVMFVNYRTPHAFTAREVDDIELFASQAATAIHSAQLFDDLNRKIEELHNTEQLLAARTDVAWIGLRTIDWSHSVANAVSKILNLLAALRRSTRDGVATMKIDRASQLVRQMARPPLPEYDAPTQAVFAIDEPLLRSLRDDISTIYNADSTTFRIEIDLPTETHVQAAQWWLQCVIGYAVKNALDAFSNTQQEREIVLGARRAGRHVEIFIRDNGPGIPPELLETLTVRPVPKEDRASGLGIGLWVTRRVMQIFNGDVHVSNVEPHGALVVLTLPVLDRLP